MLVFSLRKTACLRTSLWVAPDHIYIAKEEQDEEEHRLSTADSHLSSLAAGGVRSASPAATDADPRPSHSDPGTCNTDAGAAHSDARASDTHGDPGAPHFDPSTSHANPCTRYPNTRPAHTHADGHTPHGYAGATHTDTPSAGATARAQGIDGNIGGDQLLRDAFLFHHRGLHV